MPSLEKHEGWGNRVVVLHEEESVSEKSDFSQRTREMGPRNPATQIVGEGALGSGTSQRLLE
jgi:hypothetical protein